jgi:hypothetical protein
MTDQSRSVFDGTAIVFFLAHGVSSLALGPAPARRNIAGTRVSGPLVRPYHFCQNQK